jgi:hypothetical protein
VFNSVTAAVEAGKREAESAGLDSPDPVSP